MKAEDSIGDTLTAPDLGLKDKETIISFDDYPELDPFRWRTRRKIKTLGIAFYFSLLTAFNAAGFPSVFSTMIPGLHTTRFIAIASNAALMWACAIAPLVLAPVSEQFGRRPMILYSSILHMLCFLPQALANHIWLIILFRCLQGIASSAANSLIGGVVADVYRAKERGQPMALLTSIIFCGQGLGAMCIAYINAGAGWRWAFWLQLILNGAGVVMIFLLFTETRGSAVLDQKAAQLTKETGHLHVANTSLVHALPLWTKLRVSTTRPVKFLFTEPAVAIMALWSAALWGLVFLFFSSTGVIYPNTYHFSTVATGSVFATAIIGGVLGTLFCRFTDRFYHQSAAKSPTGVATPESRMYATCVGGALVPIALFFFAWTAQPHIHWSASLVALGLFNFGVFPIYLAAFSYLSDSYEQWASSAIAAQSLLRNILGGAMPMVVPTMYHNLRYPIAGTILASITLVFAPVPFLIVLYGGKLRRRGKVAREVADHQQVLADIALKRREQAQEKDSA